MRPDFEEFFEDENNNNIPDGAENYAKRAYKWVTSNKLIVSLSVAVVGLSYCTAYLYSNPKTNTVTKTNTVYVDTPEAIINAKNYLIADLDSMTLQSIKTKGDLVKVRRYKKEGNTLIYTAIFELKDELKYNKKVIADYKPDEKLLKP